MSIFAMVLGYIGAVCIAVFSSPSLINVIKTKDTTVISTLMFTILTVGAFGFMMQGIINMSIGAATVSAVLAVTLSNVICFLLALSVLIIKLVFVHNAKKLNISEKEYCMQVAAKAKAKKELKNSEGELKA